MAHVPLSPLGAARPSFLDDATYAKNTGAMGALDGELAAARARVAAGWGETYVERVHKKGKLTSRERIANLVDPGGRVHEVLTFVNHGRRFGELESPAAGVVTAFVEVEGRWTMVIANDNTVASGSWWPQTPEKIERAQEMALRLRLPVIYLVDCSGLYLPEQSRSFPGRTGAGHIFKKNALLSAGGVPQIAGVFGDCIAGGGYMPIISDRVVMTEQAYMVIAGAALIKGAKSQKLSSLDIGGPEVHVHQSGCADLRVPDDAAALVAIRAEVAKLPSSGADYHRHGAEAAPPELDPAELGGIFPSDHRMAYEVEQVIARLVDHGLFWELMPSRGREMIVGVGRVGGLYMGFVANRQGIQADPEHHGGRKPAGILYKEGIAKISAFSRACDADGIPLVWLQDISGFDIGVEAERLGLLGYGSSLIYTNSTNQVPMFTVLLRKASGAGYYAMAGMPYEPVVQLSTPIARLSVMEGRTLAIAAFNTKLDDEFEIVATDPEERAGIEAGMRATEERIEEDMSPYQAASQMDTDEIVATSELRERLVALAEMAYQGSGYRRVKNPRIWSLHDLAALDRPRSESPVPAGQPGAALELLVREGEDGTTHLSAPDVGTFTGALEPGQVLVPGQTAGWLRRLGRSTPLCVPAGARGVVRNEPPDLVHAPVGHGDLLYVLAPVAGEAELARGDEREAADASAALVFRTRTAGRFWHSASPGEEPLCSVGRVVAAGEPIGLIEVMKTFAQVPYQPGPDLPQRARIVRVLAGDGADVDERAALLELEPA